MSPQSFMGVMLQERKTSREAESWKKEDEANWKGFTPTGSISELFIYR